MAAQLFAELFISAASPEALKYMSQSDPGSSKYSIESCYTVSDVGGFVGMFTISTCVLIFNLWAFYESSALGIGPTRFPVSVAFFIQLTDCFYLVQFLV